MGVERRYCGPGPLLADRHRGEILQIPRRIRIISNPILSMTFAMYLRFIATNYPVCIKIATNHLKDL